jgi:O-antigen/teichoic acid export membrane protein
MCWIALGQAAAVLGALVGVRILTGVLPPDAYGRLALGMTVATFVNQTVLGPLSSGATRFFAPAREAGTLGSYLIAVKDLLLRATGGVILIASVLCLGFVALGRAEWIGLGLAALCFALLSGYNGVLNGMQNAARQRAVVALHQGLASWARFLLAAGFVVWLGGRSTTAMLGYALAILIVLASQGWFFRRTLASYCDVRQRTPSHAHGWKTDLLAYAWPLAIWGIPTWARLASDRWALQMFSSTEDVGRYAVLYQLGCYPVMIVTSLMVQLVYPVFFQRAGDASDASRLQHVYRLNRRLTAGTLLLTAVVALLVYGLHDGIFRVLVASQYRAVSALLPGMVMAGGLYATGELAAVSLLSGMNTRALLAPKIVSAVAGVLLNVLGAAWWGTPGVVGAAVFAAGVYLVWVLLVIEHSRKSLSEKGDCVTERNQEFA